jgi:ABC-type transport system involved in multi-copper enzyme maturation permease subunit
MTILSIAGMQMRELARRRLALVAGLLTVVIAALTAWGLYSLVHHVQRNGQTLSPPMVHVAAASIVILLAFFFTIALATAGALVAAPALAGEIESGIALSILARSIRRSDIVAGKWIGTLAAIGIYAFVAGGIELLVISIVAGYTPPHPYVAVAYLFGVATVICTAAIAFSARLPALAGGVVAILLYGVAWIGGILGSIGASFGNDRLVDFSTIISLVFPSDALWRGAIYSLEPAVFVAAAHSVQPNSFNPFAVSDPPTTAMLIWAIGWVVAVFTLAVVLYRRRDI